MLFLSKVIMASQRDFHICSLKLVSDGYYSGQERMSKFLCTHYGFDYGRKFLRDKTPEKQVKVNARRISILRQKPTGEVVKFGRESLRKTTSGSFLMFS